jgi:hypothetical protein
MCGYSVCGFPASKTSTRVLGREDARREASKLPEVPPPTMMISYTDMVVKIPKERRGKVRYVIDGAHIIGRDFEAVLIAHRVPIGRGNVIYRIKVYCSILNET